MQIICLEGLKEREQQHRDRGKTGYCACAKIIPRREKKEEAKERLRNSLKKKES